MPLPPDISTLESLNSSVIRFPVPTKLTESLFQTVVALPEPSAL